MTSSKRMTLSALKQMCRSMDKECKKIDGFVRLQPVTDEYGVYSAKVRGDEAVVLDFASLSVETMTYLLKTSGSVGIACVFQVRTFTQVEAAVRMGAKNI